ncbi:MAG: hypothetical protein ACTS73_00415 [Arsenophonus sp. NEOnobi-MAG3]
MPINNLINIGKLNLFADKFIINDDITLDDDAQQHCRLAANNLIFYSFCVKLTLKLKHLINPDANLTYLHHSQLKLANKLLSKYATVL